MPNELNPIYTDDISINPIDLIWNITQICPFNCSNCCVDAVHVTNTDNHIYLKSEMLTKVEKILYQRSQGNLFDQAAILRQNQGFELTFKEKQQVIENLQGFQPKIDFSGGDPLSVSETLKVIQLAAKRFGKLQITLTTTVAGLSRYDPDEISPYIGELNVTYDNATYIKDSHRPRGYVDGNLKKAAQFASAGVRVRAECPLSAQNVNEDSLRLIYINLHQAGIQKLLLMRLFPVGRGALVASDIPTSEQYQRAIHILREMEAHYGYPKLKLQCALKFFDNQHLNNNPCDLVKESFGLMADGTLLASPWAIGANGRPLHDVWILGNLAKTSLHEILTSQRVINYRKRLNENFGHCKIQAFLSSKISDPTDRIFDTSDPLYVNRYI
jgi:MoaA/NifB/PqqE/SkfB family radical SAM enzyme